MAVAGARRYFAAGEGKNDGAELPVLALPPGSAALSSSGECRGSYHLSYPLDSSPWFKARAFSPRRSCKKCSLTAASL